jgi:orotidine-5'-phosphate decarboxylase
MTVPERDAGPRIIVALDFPQPQPALELAARLAPGQCRLKVGFELFASAGPAIVESLVTRGFDVFLDLKFHDIPNTVASACRAAAALGVWMINVHALGGRRMMAAAREAIDNASRRPLLIGVTILTSHSGQDLTEVGLSANPDAEVLRLARLGQSAGLDGVVCSAQEVPRLRREFGGGFCLVTPGIRPHGAAAGDQARTMTPAQAVAAGSDYLVIGRPITGAPDPVGILESIQKEIVAV